jgi:hypothetical protein
MLRRRGPSCEIGFGSHHGVIVNPMLARGSATSQAGRAKILTIRQAVALAGLAAALICLPALRGDFVIDDRYLIVENPSLRSLGNIPGHFTHVWGEGAGPAGHTAVNVGYFRPLTSTLHTIEYAVWGANPWGWHATSIVMHALSSMLVAWLAAHLFGGGLAALGAGLIFALHPVHTEAIAAICYQTTLLSAFLALAAMAALTLATRGRTWPWLLAAGLLSMLAGLAKEEALVLLLIAAAWLLLASPRTPKRTIVSALASIGVGSAIVAVLRASIVTGSQITYFGAAGADVIVPTMLGVITLYARLLLLPLQLCPFYDWFIIPPSSRITLDVVLGVVLIGGITGGAWFLRRRLPGIALGLAWLGLGLVPVLHLLPMLNVAAERFLYLPSVGCAFALTGVLLWARPKAPRSIGALAICLLVFFSARTLWRWPDWRDDHALNQATAASFPETPTPFINLAEMEAAAGNRAAAVQYLDQARKRVPDWPVIEKVAARILGPTR